MEKLVQDFIDYYQTLSETEKFKVGAVFNQKTSGKMSPYNSPNPVAVALLKVQTSKGIKLLGVRRGIMPKYGEIAFPGGYVDCVEDPYLAVTRETLEETGLQTKPEDYQFLSMHISLSNNLVIFFEHSHLYEESIIKNLVINHEVLEFCLIDRETILAFPLHTQIRDEFFKKLENK